MRPNTSLLILLMHSLYLETNGQPSFFFWLLYCDNSVILLLQFHTLSDIRTNIFQSDFKLRRLNDGWVQGVFCDSFVSQCVLESHIILVNIAISMKPYTITGVETKAVCISTNILCNILQQLSFIALKLLDVRIHILRNFHESFSIRQHKFPFPGNS